LNECDVQSNQKLCSFHFAETDFGKGVKRRLLKSNAIPTIFEEGHLCHKTPSTSFEGHAFFLLRNSFIVFNIMNIFIILDTLYFNHDHLLSTKLFELMKISAKNPLFKENVPKGIILFHIIVYQILQI
jgi:hypothetical protein